MGTRRLSRSPPGPSRASPPGPAGYRRSCHTSCVGWWVMGVRVQWVQYGKPAAEALRAAIVDAKAGEPLAPVTVVVPSNHVGVAARRLLASGTLGPVSAAGPGLV